MKMNVIELNYNGLTELTNTETVSITGGTDDSIAHDIGETVGYFCGYLFTAGPKLIEKAATIASALF